MIPNLLPSIFGIELAAPNDDFSAWTGVEPNEIPTGYSVLGNDATNFVSEVTNGARFLSDSTSGLVLYRNYTVEPGKIYNFKIIKTEYVAGDIRLRIRDITNATDILATSPMGWQDGNEHTYKFATPALCVEISITVSRMPAGNTDYVMNSWSLKEETKLLPQI